MDLEQSLQQEFLTSQVSELIDGSLFEAPTASEPFFASEIIEIKSPPSKLISSESYVVQPKAKETSSVKTRQSMAVKSCVERPAAAREKLKQKETNRQMVLPHTLGTLPKYLRDRKGSSAQSSHVDQTRPKTAESVVSKRSNNSIRVQLQLTPEQEKRFASGAKAVTSAPDIQKSLELEELKRKVAVQAKTINRDKTQMQDLKNRTVTLEKQCEELQEALERTSEELKISGEQNKALEMRLVRYHSDKRERDASAGAAERLQSELADLVRENNELKFEMAKVTKVRADETRQLQSHIDKLKGELRTQRSSCEILINEKNHLQVLLSGRACCENKEDGDKPTSENDELLLEKIGMLEREAHARVGELSSARDDNRILTEEINHLKSQLTALSNPALTNEQASKFQKKIQQLKLREEELCQQLLMLKSKLENEKCENESKEALLKYRADHIRTLQDAENVSNARIILQIREIEELRGELKSFEKFKLAHEEEKANFNSLLNQKFKMK